MTFHFPLFLCTDAFKLIAVLSVQKYCKWNYYKYVNIQYAFISVQCSILCKSRIKFGNMFSFHSGIVWRLNVFSFHSGTVWRLNVFSFHSGIVWRLNVSSSHEY